MEDLTGKKFGRYTVISFSHRKDKTYYWDCKCECGNSSKVRSYGLKSGQSQSCGCLRTERRIAKLTKHGNSTSNRRTPEYYSWREMKRRCYDEKFKQYQDYGGRGITVCDRWLHNFENFLSDMGKKPSANHSLDRIDNNNGYSPDNCRWTNKTNQQRNQRKRKDNTSGVRGVSYVKKRDKYTAYISIDKKVKRLGYFDTLEEATKVRKEAEQTYWNKSS